MVQLELTQDVEERLKKAAEARGLKPEAYAIQVIEGAVRPVRLEKHLTKEQMQEFLDGMAAIGKDIPALPDYAYTRESFYEDHD
jgi:hypothetical protein